MLKTLTGTLHGEEDNSTKTHTGGHARDQDEGDGNTKNLTGTLGARDHEEGDNSTKAPTEVHQAKEDLTGTHAARDHNEGDASTAKTLTGGLKTLTGTLGARDHNCHDRCSFRVIGPLYRETIPDSRQKEGRLEDGRRGGLP